MELKPTYGNFQVTGTIYDFIKNKDGQIVSSGIASNKEPFKSLRIAIQTTENNVLVVELFGMTKDKVRASKRTGKGKDVKFENEDFAWDKRYNLPKDYSLSGLDVVTVTEDETKQAKNNNVLLVSYDAIDKIADLYKPGDAVFIRGGLGFNVFNGEARLRCSIQKILRADETKFDKEGNEPCAKFEQTIVIRGTRPVKEENKLYVDALIITDKNGNFVEKEFYVDIAEREKLAKNIKKLKPYTQIKIVGDIINEAIVSSEEVKEETDDWGSDTVMQRKTIEGYINSLRITMADPETIVEEAYKETDFIVKDELSTDEELSDEEIDDVVDNDEDGIFDTTDEDDMGETIEITQDNDEDDWL